MQVVLIMFRTGGERRSFSVVRSTTTIGRREDCDLRIPVGDVSRKHCRLVLSDDNVRVQDMGSSNGTFVNGERVTDAFLNPGDTVGVGPVHFVVQIDGVPSEDELTPPAPAADDSAPGGTALAADALVAAEAAEAGGGPVLEDDDLLQEIPDPAAGDPPAADAFTIDEDPVAAPESVQDVAFDSVTESDPPATATTDAPAAEAGDWDFLAEEPDAAPAAGDQVDVNLDFDPPPTKPHP